MEIGSTFLLLALVGVAGVIAGFIMLVKFMQTPAKVADKYSQSEERGNVFVKKYREADIEYYRGAALRVGMTVVLLFLVLAFNFTNRDDAEDASYVPEEVEIIEQDIPVTQQVQPPPPPPPPPPPQIQVVEDEEIIEEEPVFEETEVEMDEEVIVEEVVYVEVEEVIEEPEPEPEEPDVFTIVEEMPTFPGGQQKLLAYLASQLKYPPIARELGIEGTVVLRFIIDASGGVSNIEVVRDIGGGCGAEALRVAKTMPKWNPGRQRGKPVPVYFTMPVRFILE
jgi:protein TonB